MESDSEVPGPSPQDSSLARSVLRLTPSLAPVATVNKATLLWYRETLKLSSTCSTAPLRYWQFNSLCLIGNKKFQDQRRIITHIKSLSHKKEWETAETLLEAMQLFLEELRQGEDQPPLLLSLDARDNDEEREICFYKQTCEKSQSFNRNVLCSPPIPGVTSSVWESNSVIQ